MRHDSDLGDRLEGDIISGVSSKGAAVVEGELNTLDEPIVDTIVSGMSEAFVSICFIVMLIVRRNET